jgi:hypothetical protein
MDFLYAVWSALTWRRVLIAEALGLTTAFLITIEYGHFGDYIKHTSLHYVSMGVYVLCLVPLAFSADEAIRRHVRPQVVYPALLLINLVLSCAVAFLMLRVYCLWFGISITSNAPDVRWGFIDVGIHMSVCCSLGLLAFMNQRTADRMLEAVRGAELRRVQLDQHLLESRLAATEAQMDPKTLLVALAEVKRGFQTLSPEADRKLDEIIHTLRTALVRTAAVNTEVSDA